MPDPLDPAALAQRVLDERDQARRAAREILAALIESRAVFESDLIAWVSRYPWLDDFMRYE